MKDEQKTYDEFIDDLLNDVDLDEMCPSVFPSEANGSSINSSEVAQRVRDIHENDEKIINQFEKNEESKRILKPTILRWVCGFVLFQLIVMNLILLIVILSLVVTDEAPLGFIYPIETQSLPEVFSFLKFYISATIVELLGMLYFMIRKVFDNSIVDVFKLNRQWLIREEKKRKK